MMSSQEFVRRPPPAYLGEGEPHHSPDQFVVGGINLESNEMVAPVDGVLYPFQLVDLNSTNPHLSAYFNQALFQVNRFRESLTVIARYEPSFIRNMTAGEIAGYISKLKVAEKGWKNGIPSGLDDWGISPTQTDPLLKLQDDILVRAFPNFAELDPLCNRTHDLLFQSRVKKTMEFGDALFTIFCFRLFLTQRGYRCRARGLDGQIAGSLIQNTRWIEFSKLYRQIKAEGRLADLYRYRKAGETKIPIFCDLLEHTYLAGLMDACVGDETIASGMDIAVLKREKVNEMIATVQSNIRNGHDNAEVFDALAHRCKTITRFLALTRFHNLTRPMDDRDEWYGVEELRSWAIGAQENIDALRFTLNLPRP